MAGDDFSFDPADPRWALPTMAGVHWAVQVFTTDNGLRVDPTRVRALPDGGFEAGLAAFGNGGRGPGGVRVELDVAPGAGGEGRTTWRITAWHPTHAVKSVKLVLFGLAAEGWGHAALPAGERRSVDGRNALRWSYPWPADPEAEVWETPWAACDGATLAVRNRDVRPVRLLVHRPRWAAAELVTELVVEEDARRWRTTYTAPPIEVRTAPSAAATEASWHDHLDAITDAYGLRSWAERTDRPAWVDDVRLVVNLHGRHWSGHVFSTFEQMAAALAEVCTAIDGRQVLAYLPGWEGRYYHAYPRYRPDEALGGEAGFAALIDAAHGLGVRVMPMFGIHGANIAHYPDWARATIRTRTNRMPALVNKPDWDGDRSGEDDQVFLNPGEPAFGAHLLAEASATVARFGVDGVFLDTSGCWFNDPRHGLLDGYRRLVDGLRARHPGLLVAGEGAFDATLGIFPVHQTWRRPDVPPARPELWNRFTRVVGHLSTPAPGAGSTGVHERGFGRYRPWFTADTTPAPGHLPTVAVVGDTVGQHRDELLRVAAAAAAWTPTPADDEEHSP